MLTLVVTYGPQHLIPFPNLPTTTQNTNQKKKQTNRYWNLTSVYKGEVAAETLLEAARSDPGLDFVTLGYGIGHAFALQGNMSAAFVRH